MNIVIDDHLLREVLLEREPGWLRRRRRGGSMYTTGAWYYRLCSALARPDVLGALSGPVSELPVHLRAQVVAKVARLPEDIQLISLRSMGWRAAELGGRYGLNMLAAEALATALETNAAIAAGEGNLAPRLRAAAIEERVRLLQPV